MSDRIIELPLFVAALALAGVCALSPALVHAQEPPPPPAPPPSPEDVESAESDAPPPPERADDERDRQDEARQEEDLGEDGLPAPPSPEELERGGADKPAPANTPAPPPEQNTPSNTYDEQFLRIARTQGDPIADQFRYGTAMIAVRGTFGSIVDPPDFYKKVGRPDLAEKYKRRSTSRMVLLGSSVLLGSVGPYVFLVAAAATEPFCFTVCTPEQQRRQRTANAFYGLAAASFAGGVVGFFGSLFWSAHPVGVDARRALADEHNKSLKRNLGLPSDYSAQRTKPPVKLRFGGAPTDGGAMGVLTLEF